MAKRLSEKEKTARLVSKHSKALAREAERLSKLKAKIEKKKQEQKEKREQKALLKTKVDGLGPMDKIRLVQRIRDAWVYSYPRKLCLERATGKDGFPFCEACGAKVPKVQVDHIIPCGEFDSGYIDRQFVPSSGLMALCPKCHRGKTNMENDERRNKKKKGKTFCEQF